jgi:hypothetical protein
MGKRVHSIFVNSERCKVNETYKYKNMSSDSLKSKIERVEGWILKLKSVTQVVVLIKKFAEEV